MADRILLAVPTIADDAADQAVTIAEESEGLVVAGRVTSSHDVGRDLKAADVPVDVVVLHEDLGPIPVLELARDLNRRFPDTGLVLLTEEQSSDLLRGAMLAGIRGVVSVPLSLEDFARAIAMAGEWARSVRERFAQAGRDDGATHVGQMIALAGAKGGVGTTLLSTSLALHLASERDDQSVCLVDLDLQAGDVRAYLDISHQRSITDMVAVANELTTRHFDESLYRHASGLRILLPPLDGEMGEDVDTAAARQILGALRARFDVLIVDVGATMNEATATAVEMADAVLVVTTTDVPALRAANRLVALWDRLAIRREDVHGVVNRVSRDNEVQPDLCARVLRVPVLRTSIASQFRAVEYAVNTGRLTDAAALVDGMGPMASEITDVIRRSASEPASEDEGAAERQSRLTSRVAAGESGQATTEFVASLPLVVIAILVAVQFAIFGWVFVRTQDASRGAARAFAVADAVDSDGDGVWDDVASAALGRLPATWRAGTELRQTGSDITVRVPVPSVVPFVDDLGSVSSTSGGMRE